MNYCIHTFERAQINGSGLWIPTYFIARNSRAANKSLDRMSFTAKMTN
jgi:hypothetical protein